MARLVIGLTCFGIGIVASATAAHAQESPDDEVLSAAHDANVDPTNLLGATLSTREACGCDISPRDYLIRVGELPAPYIPSQTTGARPPSVWDAIARCESHNNWATNSGNSYYGGLQEDMTFWRNYGGLAYAPRPDMASRSAQIAVAERGLAKQGWGAWPTCSRVVGMR